jgi:starch synthase
MAARTTRIMPDTPRRSVLLLGSEALPFAKTGGLADVLGALPSALARLGWDVTVALPRYRGIEAGHAVDTFPITIGGYVRDAGFFEAALPAGARALLVDCPDLFDRDALYGVDGVDYPDNPRRFGFLVRAVLEFVARRGVAPSVIHAHDWQAGLAPVYLKTLYASHPVLGGTPTVFTIHNLAYQGLCDPDWLPRLDLGWDLFTTQRLEYWNRISFLKGGITDAAVVTTVSRRYAQEIQTPALGFGFDGILRERRDDLVGILNGIDTTQWDPEHDPHIPSPFSAKDLSGKAKAKAEMLARYQLPVTAEMLARPVVGMVSRMVDQKGFDLVAALADQLPRLDATFVVLGTGAARYQDMWVELEASFPTRIGVRIGFDEALAHLIEAGADVFLMPSHFEPCGLNQMYSLRYGTVPVVRAVGGLADTVTDYRPSRLGARPEPASTASAQATGFVFEDYTPAALLETLQRALAVYKDPPTWQRLQRAGMRQDHSWDRSAREYVTIYGRALGDVNPAGRTRRPRA